MLNTIFLSYAFPKIGSQTDAFCNWCIQFLRETAEIYGCSYAEINIALFVVIMPLLILTFFILTIANMYNKSKKMKIVTWSIIATIAISLMILMFPALLCCMPTPS